MSILSSHYQSAARQQICARSFYLADLHVFENPKLPHPPDIEIVLHPWYSHAILTILADERADTHGSCEAIVGVDLADG